MNWWRALPAVLMREDAVLVTVARTQGSVPREAGASMLVTLTGTADTIGGGHLEWEAMAQARAMLLQSAAEPAMRRLSLGASLGQCCGGVVWLVCERLGRSSLPEWKTRVAQLDAGKTLQRLLAASDARSAWRDAAGAAQCQLQIPPGPADGAGWTLIQHISPEKLPVTIFGAGHVGAAIVRLLAPLGAQIRWVDPRNDQFGTPPANVACFASDAPEEAIASAPVNSFFLVLTHSHALDLTLSEHILRRADFAWFGLIGSKTKRARFEHRLHALGLDTRRMSCPIGIAGIRDKSPEAIAIAVVAQVLQVKEARTSLQGAPLAC